MDDLTTKLAEALRLVADQALMATRERDRVLWKRQRPMFEAAIEVLRLYDAAKAQPKQAAEPFAFVHKRGTDDEEFIHAEAVNGRCPDCEPLFLFAAPVAQAEQWQPISTAPKDAVILLVVDGAVYAGCWYETEFRELRDTDGFYVGQHDAQAFWCAYVMGECEPTHWMPIPQPPKDNNHD